MVNPKRIYGLGLTYVTHLKETGSKFNRATPPVCDMVYTPREMLRFIYERFTDELPQKGDIVLTGTPGGVAFQVPVWKSWLSDILNLDRFVKLVASFGSGKSNKKFLKPGDIVEVSGGVLGAVTVIITEEYSL